METIRPFDILNSAKGKEIQIDLKNSSIFKGKLKAFDPHLNIVLFEATEIVNGIESDFDKVIVRGDTIVSVKILEE